MSNNCADKDVKNAKWIHQCEAAFATSLEKIAEDIFQKEELHMVLLTGPTCAGKTTTANLLERYFSERGRRILPVSIDDFYHDHDRLEEISKRKGLEDIDYESVDTIDLDALRIFTEEMVHSDEVHSPIFDFRKACRTGYRSIRIRKGDLFLFEGIQVLYPQIMKLFAAYGVVSIYIAPRRHISTKWATFSPNEIRLMRRIVRDADFRATPPEKTFDIWDGVRRNEELNIFPYAVTCDYQVDSTMDYELGILAPHLKKLLPTVPKDSVFYANARDILLKLEGVDPISDELILPWMLYKEFV